MEGIIVTKDLEIGYKDRSVGSCLNISLHRGMLTALIGRNGAGKSTLIKTLTGHLRPLRGSILIDGTPITEYSRKALASKLSLVGAETNIAGGLRLEEMVALGRIPHTGYFGRLNAEDRKIVEEAMELVGIMEKKNSFVAELSDGERQKGKLARGFAQQTPIIIMDEPFTFLDVASRIEILSLMKQICHSQERSILISTHEVTEAMQLADRAWVFVESHVVEGKPTELVAQGVMNRIFPNRGISYDNERGEYVLKQY